jgi:hypothetical protein
MLFRFHESLLLFGLAALLLQPARFKSKLDIFVTEYFF